MKRAREQQGNLMKSRGRWYLRFREDERQPDGTIKRVQKVEFLAPATGETRAKDSRALLRLRDERMAVINSAVIAARTNPDSLLTVTEFVEQKFLPMVKEQRRASTYKAREAIWRNQLKAHIGDIRLRDFTIRHGQQFLNDVARERPNLHRVYLRQIKATASAIFADARRLELITGEPMRGTLIPPGQRSESRGAYDLEDIKKMLLALEGTARVLVATAGFTGMRRAELQGLRWADYDGENIHVARNLVCGLESPTKTPASTAAIPVIAPLKALLDAHRQRANGSPYVFSTPLGSWLRLGHYAEHHVIPMLERIGIPWRGWHAFRRGLATNLYRLGVADKHIQAILRHANLATTMDVYVHTSSADSQRAMAVLESALLTPSLVQ